MDLSKRIKINSHYQITYARLLSIILITLLEVLALMSFHDWKLVPEVFFVLSNMVFILSRRPVEDEMEDLQKKIEENQTTISKQQGLIFLLEEKLREMRG